MGDAIEYHSGPHRPLVMPRNHERLDLLDGFPARCAPVGRHTAPAASRPRRSAPRPAHSRLHDTILDRRNAQRSLLAVRFRDVHPPDCCGRYGLLAELFRQFTQPFRLHTLRCPRTSGRPSRAAPSLSDSTGRRTPDIRSIHLVVQRVEAVRGCALRFGMERLLKLPTFGGGNRLTPISRRSAHFCRCSEPRPLPSTGITRTSAVLWASPTPPSAACPRGRSGWATRPTDEGLPCCVRSPLASMLSPLPRWDRG